MTHEKKEKILNLIAKLKALASNNPNEEEAALAGARMQQLIDRYKIEQAELFDIGEDDEPETGCDEFYTEEGKRFSRWKLDLGYRLAEFNNCRAVRSQGHYTWDAESGCRVLHPAKMEIVGTKENIAACKYVFMYLFREIERLSAIALEKYNRLTGTKGGKSFANAFKAGAVTTIIKRLKEQKERTKVEAGTAMVLFDKEAAAARDWMDKNMNTSKSNCATQVTSGAGYAAGKKAGGRVHLGGGNSGSLGAGQKSLPRGR